MTTPISKIGFKADEGILYPTQMINYSNNTTPDPPYKEEQTGNIGQLGTNLFGPFNANPTLTHLEYTLPNGTITINKNYVDPPGYYTYDVIMNPGSTTYSLNATYLDGLYIVMWPYTEDLDEVEKWNLLYHTNEPGTQGYYYQFFENLLPDYSALFDGSLAEEDEDTQPEGGMGQLDVFSNDIPFPTLPILNFLDTNMIRLYNPTVSDVQNIASYLWTSNSFLNLAKIQNDPMEALIGFNILPVSPTVTANQPFIIGDTNSGLTMNQVSQQYYYIDFGKISVGENLGTYYDWSPYTRADIYLPFIGSAQLDVDEIIGSELWCQYMVDVLSGNCTAMLHIKRIYKKNDNEGLNAIMYHWNGNIATPGPLSAKDYVEQLKTHIGTVATLAIGAASVAATGGASTPVVVGAGVGALGAAGKEITTPTPVQHSGTLAGNHGMLGVQFPYVTLSRPNVTAPSSVRHDEGLKSSMTGKIGDMRGFIKMQTVHIEGVNGTQAEKDEIEKILKEGILY